MNTCPPNETLTLPGALRLACLLFPLAVHGALPAEEASTLLPNPGFETPATDGQTPADWAFSWEFTHSADRERGVVKQRPETRWDKATVHGGGRSLFVANHRPQDDGVWTAEGVSLTPGARYYRLQAWMKTSGMVQTDARVCGVFQGPNRKWLGANYDAIVVNQDRDWTLYTGYLEPPKGTLTMRLRLWLNMRYTGTGQVWFDDLSLTPAEEIPNLMQRYEDDRPAPSPTADQQTKGYLCYTRNYLRLIFPTSVPDPKEIERPLSCFLTPGEREPVTLSVFALRDLSRVRVAVSPLRTESGAVLPADGVTVRSVRYGLKRGQGRWGPFHSDLMEVPLYLSSQSAVEVAVHRSQQFWITLAAPPAAVPGRYGGTVTVSAAGAPSTDVPLTVQVLPFKLEEPVGVSWGMYHRPAGGSPSREAAWRDMREHGMNTVGLCCNLGAKMELAGAAVSVTFDGSGDLERALTEYAAAGFDRPLVWLMGSEVLRWCKAQAKGDEALFARCYRQVIEAVLELRERRGWPEIIFQPLDEPFEHTDRLDDTETCLRVLKSIPGVRTEEDGPNGNPSTLERVYDLCDVLVYHDGPTLRRGTYDAEGWQALLDRARSDGKELWFYNLDLTGWHPEVLRFGYGFGLHQSGGSGVLEWSYQLGWKPEKPTAVYENSGAILYQFPPAGDETGGPTLAWEAAREGVDDYRYLATLRRLVKETAAAGGTRADRARELWAQVEQRLSRIDFNGSTGAAAQGDWTGRKDLAPDGTKIVSGDHKMANGLGFDDYDALRRLIADALLELRAP